jgi:hypothetical protein
MSDTQPADGTQPQSAPHRRPIRDTPLPTITMSFDGAGTVQVEIAGLPTGANVYGIANESEPTQALSGSGNGPYEGSYTPGTDTAYTVEMHTAAETTSGHVLAVNIPPGRGSVNGRAQLRPLVMAILSDTTGALSCAASADGQNFTTPGSLMLGMTTSEQPAAANVGGVPTVLAIVGSGIQVSQFAGATGTWNAPTAVTLPGLTATPTAVAVAAMGAQAWLAVASAGSIQVFSTDESLLSPWTLVHTQSASATSTIGLGSNGVGLYLAWKQGSTLYGCEASYAGSTLTWDASEPILTGSAWSQGPSVSSEGRNYTLICVDTSGQVQHAYLLPQSPWSALTAVNGMQGVTKPAAITRYWSTEYFLADLAGTPMFSSGILNGIPAPVGTGSFATSGCVAMIGGPVVEPG